MPADKIRRALVVDDEVIIRRLIAKALTEQGFTCELAADGEQAAKIIAGQQFDLLITDLRMPNRHGHALVRDVLQVDSHPIVIVHTGVLEPKLAIDLLARGVDDVVYKPCDVNLLAAKARAMVDREAGRASHAQPADSSPAPTKNASKLEAGPTAVIQPISLESLKRKLDSVSAVLPISNAALDVYQMTRGDWSLSQVAAAIQRDAALAAEVLRLANSSFYNPAARKVISLDQAVMAIGQKRIGELAIAVNALASVTPGAVPWMDLQLAWKRSMAAGIALEAIIEDGDHQEFEDGLALSATLYPLGRVVLGMMFPELYQQLIDHAWTSGQTLREQERTVIPLSHTATLAQLLTTWRIPVDVAQPLKHASDDFAALTRLPDPLRLRVELVKVAVLLGRLAVDHWEIWDAVEMPPAAVLQRLKLPEARPLVQRVRDDVEKLAGFCPGGGAAQQSVPPPLARPIPYCNLDQHQNDLFAEILPSLGFQPLSVQVEDLREDDDPPLINGLEAPATRFAAYHSSGAALVVTTADRADGFAKFAATVALPASYGRLREAAMNILGSDRSALQPKLYGDRNEAASEDPNLIAAEHH